MDSKINILVGVLVVGIVLISGWWIWNSQIYSETQNEVTITTDKTEYKQGETVKITIKNNLNISLRNYDTVVPENSEFYNQFVGWGFIEIFEDGNWSKIEPLWRCGNTCFAKCKLSGGFFVLGSKGTTKFPEDFRHFEWNQTRLICNPGDIKSEPVVPGTYRVSSTFWDENKELDTQRIFYSNEFIIREDSEVTLTTDKTEYKQGEIVKFRTDGKVMITKQGDEKLPPYSVKDSAGNKLQLRHSCAGELGMGYDEYCENGKIKNAKATATPMIEDVESTAKQFVVFLSKGEFDEANKMLAKIMVDGLKNQNFTLEMIWSGVIAQSGKFKEIKGTNLTKEMGYKCVYVTCDFEKASLDVKVVFDEDKKVAGLFFFPPKAQKAYRPPEYADNRLFTERGCVVGDEWRLLATLTIPKGKVPFPVVVLVHGSGPHDRDETIGVNKPFKDLAWGLASRGIAVLGYEKRTKQYPRQCVEMTKNFTVDDEVIDDALTAIEALRKEERIDQGRFFVLGHSLGAMLAPRIAAQDKGIAGLILLAGCPKGLYVEKLLEQTEYLASLDGKIDETEAKQLEEIKGQLKKIRELDIREDEIVLGASKAYWADLMTYDPIKTAKDLDLPMLILQGERDYQVTREDFRGWEEGLAGQDGVCFKLYSDLNHLFIAGTGKSIPAEYEMPGNIAQVVIEDIVEWIKSQSN